MAFDHSHSIFGGSVSLSSSEEDEGVEEEEELPPLPNLHAHFSRSLSYRAPEILSPASSIITLLGGPSTYISARIRIIEGKFGLYKYENAESVWKELVGRLVGDERMMELWEGVKPDLGYRIEEGRRRRKRDEEGEEEDSELDEDEDEDEDEDSPLPSLTPLPRPPLLLPPPPNPKMPQSTLHFPPFTASQRPPLPRNRHRTTPQIPPLIPLFQNFPLCVYGTEFSWS